MLPLCRLDPPPGGKTIFQIISLEAGNEEHSPLGRGQPGFRGTFSIIRWLDPQVVLGGEAGQVGSPRWGAGGETEAVLLLAGHPSGGFSSHAFPLAIGRKQQKSSIFPHRPAGPGPLAFGGACHALPAWA